MENFSYYQYLVSDQVMASGTKNINNKVHDISAFPRLSLQTFNHLNFEISGTIHVLENNGEVTVTLITKLFLTNGKAFRIYKSINRKSYILTDVMTSCKNLKGGFAKSFSVSGGFLINFPRLSWVFLDILGSIVPFGSLSQRTKQLTTQFTTRNPLISKYLMKTLKLSKIEIHVYGILSHNTTGAHAHNLFPLKECT